MMTSANLELVHSIFAAWERGDYNWTGWAHPEIEFVYPDGPSPNRYTGLTAMGEGSRDWLSAWEDFRFVADEFRELDHKRVLVLVRYSGHGKTSGLDLGEIGAKGAQLFFVRDSKVTKFVRYLDRERALADLGLKE